MNLKKIVVPFGIAASTVFLLASAPANAQATRTWVSGVGDDANPCSRTAPCKTYAGAISKTAPAGEINCLDPGGFGTLTVTKSISIVCEYTEGGVLSAGVNGFLINAAATDVVTLSGQDIEGFGTGTNGIRILSAAAVHINKSRIHAVRGGGSGISVENSTGSVNVFVTDTYIADSGNSTTTGGIVARPTGSGSVFLSVNRSQVNNNTLGIRADSSATTGTIRGVVRDTVVAGNTNNGITANSGGTVATLMVDHASVSGNGFGLVAAGNANGTLLATNTSVTANNTGLNPIAPGQIFTYKTNAVNGNFGTDGTFTSPITPE